MTIWMGDNSAKGVEFPNEFDRRRIAGYPLLQMLREGDHALAFKHVQAEIEKNQSSSGIAVADYVPVNLLGRLSERTADALFLDPPAIQAEENVEVTKLLEEKMRQGLTILMRDAVDDLTVYGNVGIKAYGTGKDTQVDTVHPSILFRGEDYFPWYQNNNEDIRKTKAPVIATPVNKGGVYYIVFEVHEPGEVIYRAYEWLLASSSRSKVISFALEGELGNEVEVSQIINSKVTDYKTTIDEPTLWILKNKKYRESSFWGGSDYTKDLQALQDSINHQFSALQAHSDELLKGGHLILDETMKAMLSQQAVGANRTTADFGRNPRSLSSPSKGMMSDSLDIIYESSQTSGMTRHVARSSQYEGAFKNMELQLALFERITGVSIEELFGKATAPESGKALRIKKQPEIARFKGKRLIFSGPFIEVLTAAIKLMGKGDIIPSVRWAELYPLTEEEKTDIAVKQVGGKTLASHKKAIALAQNISAEDAEKEVEQINKEEPAPGFPSYSPFGGK
jgi:hypothetical protein